MNETFFTRGNGFEKWIWIELTGFDLGSRDLGVGDFIGRCGFVPDGVSLLLYWPGIVLRPAALEDEIPLMPCEQSYGGHPFAPERPRQPWTNQGLYRLIGLLHDRGCRVYLSYFNMFSYRADDGSTVTDPYFADKLYLCETRRNGQRQSSLHVLKTLADGQPFEDVLQPATVQALIDYSFDGVQIADGISSPRISLEQGDYSDNMVAQFLSGSGLSLPENLAARADGDADKMENRAAWIWQEHRRDWIDFHTRRWEQFFAKYMARLRAAGKEALFNSAWTRDPFEAMYRYGVDYRRVARTGVRGCMVEDVSAGLAILSQRDNGYLMNDEQRRRLHYEFLTALMLNRAAMPGLMLLPLAGIHDTMEQWGVLEHMPTSMTRNVMSNLNTFVNEGGCLRPITNGPFYCLSDGLKASDWAFIRGNWDIGFTPHAQAAAGVTLLWSDARLDAELDAFIKTRRTPTHRLVSELLYAGTPIFTVARAENLAGVYGPLLVTHADLLPAGEWAAVREYDRGPVLLIGSPETAGIPDGFTAAVTESNAFGGIRLAVQGGDAKEKIIRNDRAYSFDARLSLEPLGALWTHPLDFSPLCPEFFLACAQTLVRLSGAPELSGAMGASEAGVPRQVCKAIAVRVSQDEYRVFLLNDDYYYNHPTVTFDRPIAGIVCLTKYSGYQTEHDERSFTARVPGRGMEAFAVRLAPAGGEAAL